MVKGKSRFSVQSIVRAIGSLVAILLLIQWFRQLGLQEVVTAMARIPLPLIFLAAGVIIISRFAITARWYVLLRSAGSGVTIGQALRLTFAGLFASNFLPTTIGGDVVRLAGGIQLRIDGALCAASLIVDRLTGVIGMATLLPVGLLHLWAKAGTNQAYLFTHFQSFAGIVPSFVTSWVGRLWERARKFVLRVFHALSLWLKNPRSLVSAILFTWLHMVCLFCVLWLFIIGMGEGMSVWMVGGLWSIVYFVTLLPLSINGLGIQEVAIFFFFSTIGGLSMQVGLSLAILIRAFFMIASLPGAAFIPSILIGAKDRSGSDLVEDQTPLSIPSGLER